MAGRSTTFDNYSRDHSHGTIRDYSCTRRKVAVAEFARWTGASAPSESSPVHPLLRPRLCRLTGGNYKLRTVASSVGSEHEHIGADACRNRQEKRRGSGGDKLLPYGDLEHHPKSQCHCGQSRKLAEPKNRSVRFPSHRFEDLGPCLCNKGFRRRSSALPSLRYVFKIYAARRSTYTAIEKCHCRISRFELGLYMAYASTIYCMQGLSTWIQDKYFHGYIDLAMVFYLILYFSLF